MSTVKIPGVYDKEPGNFFVNSIAKYVRDNNYPDWSHQFCDIIGENGRVFNYIISKDDSHSETMKEFAAQFPEEFDISSGVLYKVEYADFVMLIDNHYYWATL